MMSNNIEWFGAVPKRELLHHEVVIVHPHIIGVINGVIVEPRLYPRTLADVDVFIALGTGGSESAREYKAFRAYPALSYTAETLASAPVPASVGQSVGWCSPSGVYFPVGAEGHSYSAEWLSARVLTFHQWVAVRWSGKYQAFENTLYRRGWKSVGLYGTVLYRRDVTIEQGHVFEAIAKHWYEAINTEHALDAARHLRAYIPEAQP